MRRHSPSRGLAATGIAAGGLVLAHWLAYVLAVPDPHSREALLGLTGHQYWPFAVRVAGVLAVSAAVAVSFRAWNATHGSGTPDESFGSLASRLAVLQVFGFVVLEVVERAAAGGDVGSLFASRVFFVGLAVQVVCALAGGMALLWFGRAALTIVAALRDLRRTQTASGSIRIRPLESSRRLQLPVCGAAGVRGPPTS
jgi:hypothetical protein